MSTAGPSIADVITYTLSVFSCTCKLLARALLENHGILVESMATSTCNYFEAQDQNMTYGQRWQAA